MCLREKIGPDPRNFNQRVSLGRNDLLIRTFLNSGGGMFKSDTEVQSRLNEELLKLNNEIMSGREDFSSSIKNWYDAKNPDFKTLIKRLVRK